jgi:hypothetical protein
MSAIEKKKSQIKEILNDSFVDNYDFFKDTIHKINELFGKYDIDFRYDYNTFCREYIDKCMNVIDENPDIDLMENKYFLVYGAIAASMVLEKEKEYNVTKRDE